MLQALKSFRRHSSLWREGNSQNQTPEPNIKEEIEEGHKVDFVDEKLWQDILSSARGKNTTIEALLRAARPVSFDGETLTLGVYYQFHKERLEVGSNRRALEEIVGGVLSVPVRINYQLANKPKASEKKSGALTDAADESIIAAAKEIFGN